MYASGGLRVHRCGILTSIPRPLNLKFLRGTLECISVLTDNLKFKDMDSSEIMA